MTSHQSTPTKRNLPPESILSPSTPDLVTPPQPSRPLNTNVQATPTVQSSRPSVVTPVARLAQRHEYTPKTPTKLSRPPLTLSPSPEPNDQEGLADPTVVTVQPVRHEEELHTSNTRVPAIWDWLPEFEPVPPLTVQREPLLEYFGEPFVPSVASASITDEEEREIFGRIRDFDSEVEGDSEEGEVTPLILSYPAPDETPPPSPRPNSDMILGDDEPGFSNSSLAESVKAFEANLDSRRQSGSSPLPDVSSEAVSDEDNYAASIPTPRPRLPLRVRNPSVREIGESLSPADILRHARAIAEHRMNRNLCNPLPTHRRSFSMPEMPRVAVDSKAPPHSARPILTRANSHSCAEQFGWDDNLKVIKPEALAHTRRNRSKSDAPHITEYIIRRWVKKNWNDLKQAFDEMEERKLAEARRWEKEHGHMLQMQNGAQGLGLGTSQSRQVMPLSDRMDIDPSPPEAVPMTRSSSCVRPTLRHRPTASDGDLQTGTRQTGDRSESPPISAVLGRSEVSLWLTQQRHVRQSEKVKEKIRSRHSRRQRDEQRHKEPGVPTRKDREKYKRRNPSPGGPRPMREAATGSDGSSFQQEVDLSTLEFKFAAPAQQVPAPIAPPSAPSSSEVDDYPQDPATATTGEATYAQFLKESFPPADSPRNKGKGKAKATDDGDGAVEPLTPAYEDDIMEVDPDEDGFDSRQLQMVMELSAAESPVRSTFDLFPSAGESSSSPARAAMTNQSASSFIRPLGSVLEKTIDETQSASREPPFTPEDCMVVPESPTLPYEPITTDPPVLPLSRSLPVSTSNGSVSVSLAVHTSSLPPFSDTGPTLIDPAPRFFLHGGSVDPVANLPRASEATTELATATPANVQKENGMWLTLPAPDWPENLLLRYGHNEIKSGIPVIIEPFIEPEVAKRPDASKEQKGAEAPEGPEVPSFSLTPPTPPIVDEAGSFAEQQDAPPTEPSSRTSELLQIPPKNWTRDHRRRNTWHAIPKKPPKPTNLLPSASISLADQLYNRLDREWEIRRLEMGEIADRISKSLGLEPLTLPFYSPRVDQAEREKLREQMEDRMKEAEGREIQRDESPEDEEQNGRRKGIDAPRTSNDDRPRLGRSLSHHILGVRNIDDVARNGQKEDLKASRVAPRPPIPDELKSRRITARTQDTPILSPGSTPGSDTPVTDSVKTPRSLPPTRTPQVGPLLSNENNPHSTIAPKQVRSTRANHTPPQPQVGIAGVVIDALTGALGQMWRTFNGGREHHR